MRIHSRLVAFALANFSRFFSSLSQRAGFVETFDNGSDDGDWHLTSNPDALLVIEPDGGDPGPCLRGQLDSAVPTWYVPIGTHPAHLSQKHGGCVK